jgi:hypothetical protein
MELIKTLSEIYSNKTVSLSFTFKDDKFTASLSEISNEDCVPPFNINGNITEITDENFINLLKEPMEKSSKLIHNINVIEEGLKKKLDEKIKKSNKSKEPKSSENNIETKTEESPTLF